MALVLNTGNGDLNNQGHQLDIARWAIDPDQTHPVRAMAIVDALSGTIKAKRPIRCLPLPSILTAAGVFQRPQCELQGL